MTTKATPKPPQTTIKVPVPLRKRIAGGAADEGVTAAAFLTALVDRYERDRRLAGVGHAYQVSTTDEDYAATTNEWDALSGEGVDGD